MATNINIPTNTCYDSSEILSLGGVVEENSNGVVYVYMLDNVGVLAPVVLSETCCQTINPAYTFDTQTQECRWSPLNTATCEGVNDVRLIINPQGNDGTLFYVNDGDTCGLNIDFNYLVKIKCETIADIIAKIGLGTSPCDSSLSIFETFNASLTLDIVTSANTLITVFESLLFPTIGTGNLYSHLTTKANSGFYVCGDSGADCVPLSLNVTGVTSNSAPCGLVMNNILTELFAESNLTGTTTTNAMFASALPSSALTSNWLNYSAVITNQSILDSIANQKIKITVRIGNSCSDFCLLMDSIQLNKVCTHVERTDIFVTKSPGFTLEKVIDNKKSWLGGTGNSVNRVFSMSNSLGTDLIRQTDYDTNDDRLVINSKEIDLDINLAAGIETDVWCHIAANPCLLTGVTNCDPCVIECGSYDFMDAQCFDFMDDQTYDFMDGESNTTLNHSPCNGDNMIDFSSLLTEPLSAITTLESFEYFMTSELIDAKNRKTISGYPTLRALYDRYMNSSLYCASNSSRFTYLTMEQFAKMVGNYWVDVIEQVVPATSIWGSVAIYTNTIFDQQKFKYKAYSSLYCTNPYNGMHLPGQINGPVGNSAVVNVITSSIPIPTTTGLTITSQITNTCNIMYVAQMNSSSEFIGTVTTGATI